MLQVNFKPGNTAVVGGSELELVQFHFHTPSEHTFDGVHTSLEVHLVRGISVLLICSMQLLDLQGTTVSRSWRCCSALASWGVPPFLVAQFSQLMHLGHCFVLHLFVDS